MKPMQCTNCLYIHADNVFLLDYCLIFQDLKWYMYKNIAWG